MEKEFIIKKGYSDKWQSDDAPIVLTRKHLIKLLKDYKEEIIEEEATEFGLWLGANLAACKTKNINELYIKYKNE